VQLQSNGLAARNLLQCKLDTGLATLSQMSKMRMRKQMLGARKRKFCECVNWFDAPKSIEPHSWESFAEYAMNSNHTSSKL